MGKTSKAPGLTYVGQAGHFVQGLPPRDLTAEEVAELTDAQKAEALASGLYLATGQAPAKEGDE